MRIDLTLVDPIGNRQLADLEYECELEITDINFIMGYKDDPINMRKFIRKFMLNQICLSKLIGRLIRNSRPP